MTSDSLQTIHSLFNEISPHVLDIRAQLLDQPVSEARKTFNDLLNRNISELGLIGERMDETGFLIEIDGRSPAKSLALWIDLDPECEKKLSPGNAASLPMGNHLNDSATSLAVGLGVAWILNKLKGQFTGRALLFFRSCDEQEKIRECPSKLKNVNGIFGLQMHPFIQSGGVSIPSGGIYPSETRFLITIHRRHHLRKHQLYVDLIQIAAQVITTLNQMPSRKTDPLKSASIELVSIQSKGTEASVPESVELKGVFRTFDPKGAEKLIALSDASLQGIGDAYGAEIQLKSAATVKPLINDPSLTLTMRNAFEEIFGQGYIVPLTFPSYRSNAYYMRSIEIPISIMYLGVNSERFTSRMQTHEKLPIEIGIKSLAWTLLKSLSSRNSL